MNEMSENAQHVTHLKTASHVVVILEWLCNSGGACSIMASPSSMNVLQTISPIPHTSVVRNALSRVHSM